MGRGRNASKEDWDIDRRNDDQDLHGDGRGGHLLHQSHIKLPLWPRRSREPTKRAGDIVLVYLGYEVKVYAERLGAFTELPDAGPATFDEEQSDDEQSDDEQSNDDCSMSAWNNERTGDVYRPH